jgi:hypothetical protein
MKVNLCGQGRDLTSTQLVTTFYTYPQPTPATLAKRAEATLGRWTSGTAPGGSGSVWIGRSARLPRGAGCKMRTATVVRVTAAIALLAAEQAASAARADDQIKAGKWEFSVLVPGVTHLSPEMQQQPGVQITPDGMTMSRTGCINSDDPLPPMARGPSAPRDANRPCKVDKTEVSGGTVQWSTSCTTPQVVVHEEGVVHYHGETLNGEVTVRTTLAGHEPTASSQPITGRSLGPCDDK